VNSQVQCSADYGVLSHDLNQAIAESEAASEQLALLIVEIEQIQRVETALGFSAGAKMASEFRGRMGRMLRDRDQLHQISDRKFWIVIRAAKNEGHAVLAANKVWRAGQEPFSVGAHALKLEPAVGIALFPRDAGTADELVRRADLALLNTRGAELPIKVYSEANVLDIASSWQVEHDFDQALEDGEMELYYQPKIDLRTFRPCGAEALLRWNHPVRGLLLPGAFMATAERTGRLESVTRFVIDAALRQSLEWPALWGELPVSVNVPPVLLDSGRLVDHLRDSMRIWSTPSYRLILEVTEESAFRRPEQSFALLAQLRDEGISVSIDDFGTGYSSMTYFKDLPADEIKIDRSFVQNLPRDQRNAHLVRVLIDLAHTFGYSVVAEGVEDEETLRMLVKLGCDVAQGFGISEAISQREFIDWLHRYQGQHRTAR
jgi:EAL domain-containing protein (putative c-di-GMP-specific phosphodiesterase class I)/GGDEF domain-containing protein